MSVDNDDFEAGIRDMLEHITTRDPNDEVRSLTLCLTYLYLNEYIQC